MTVTNDVFSKLFEIMKEHKFTSYRITVADSVMVVILNKKHDVAKSIPQSINGVKIKIFARK